MQVFIVGSPLETAQALSKRHLNNQINEASIILAALNGAKAWSNHPCVLQYRGYEEWLLAYKACLEDYYEAIHNTINPILQKSIEIFAKDWSNYADVIRPQWHDQRYYDNMKARLYTKNPQHYAQFAEYGSSEENHYFVDGSWRKYVNGKRVE